MTRSVRRAVAWGPGPRASQALMLAARARAVLDGRLSPSIDDVAALAGPVLRHRMALSFAARADGMTLDRIVDLLSAERELAAARFTIIQSKAELLISAAAVTFATGAIPPEAKP